ncbi:MAG: citrate lyase subunit beta / citryl-CoA lyase [Thermoanaerobacteraceae bacterium]|nr:citrate lyase subunit beta / citryl-CoA lyase [Thermoanaerobacteraceae bacterium]
MIGRVALFVPASSPAMLNSSAAFDADSLIFDLEDAVALSEKDATRELLREALNTLKFDGKTIVVRINSLATDFWEMDMKYIVDTPANAVMIPKAGPAEVKAVSKFLDSKDSEMAIIPLIEMASAVEEITTILGSSPRVKGILFGAEDYTADMGISRTREGDEVYYARARLANAIHAFGVEGLDTPFTDVNDMEGLKNDAMKGKKLGYTGKAAINPRQIEIIKQVYAPTEDEINYALKVINSLKRAGGKGVFAVDGKMIDAPIIARARITLERAGIEVDSVD